MSDFPLMLKPAAFVSFYYELEDDGVITTTSGTTVEGPQDFGEDPYPFNTLFIQAFNSGGLVTPDIQKTILHFANVGHILPMEWTIERKEYDNATNTLQNTSFHTLTLVTSATFTCETSLTGGYAVFTATFKSPV